MSGDRDRFAIEAMRYAGWLCAETKGHCKPLETFKNMMEWWDICTTQRAKEAGHGG
jgi:hypothetical protein